MWRAPLKRALGSASVTRQLLRTGAGGLIVLCYHDLRETEDFRSWLRLEVTEFRRHLRALLELGTFVPPSALDRVQDLPTRRLQFLLTFDDGCPNNLRLGAAALEETGIPALFFVSTHHMVSGQPFWFDRIVSR